MKKLITVALGFMLMVGLSGLVVAGSLDSPGAPSAGSGMYTLQNLYDYLTSGTALTVQSSFQEPTSGPGSTMKTTREIGDDIKSLFDLCATTTAASVESGKPFFCTQPGSWGFQTGTALLAPTPTPTPTQTPTQTPTFTPTATATPWCAENGGYWSEDDLGGYGCWFLGGTYGGNCNSECGLKGLVCRQSNWNDTGCLIGTHFGMHGTCQTASETSRPGMPLDGSTEWYRISVNQDCAANIHPGSVRLCVCDQP